MAIPSILTLVVLLTMFAFEGCYVAAFIIGFIALIWLLSSIFYQGQQITITLQEGSFVNIFEKNVTLDLRAFIKSRHPDGLTSLSLFIADDSEVQIVYSGDLPRSINYTEPKLFEANFSINRELIERSNDLPFVLCAKLQSGRALFIGFPIKTYLPEDKSMESIKLGDIEMKSKKTKIKGIVSKKQIHRLLEKASQPIKKS